MRRRSLETASARRADHPHVAEILGNLAIVAVKRHQITEATALLQRALAIFQTNQMGDSNSAACIYNTLGVIARGEGDCEGSRVHFQHSVAIYQRIRGPENPVLIKVLTNLGVNDVFCGRPDEGVTELNNALNLAERQLGPTHPAVAEVLGNYALALRRIKRKSDAKRMEERAREILAQSSGDALGRYTVDVGDMARSGSP